MTKFVNDDPLMQNEAADILLMWTKVSPSQENFIGYFSVDHWPESVATAPPRVPLPRHMKLPKGLSSIEQKCDLKQSCNRPKIQYSQEVTSSKGEIFTFFFFFRSLPQIQINKEELNLFGFMF